MRRVLIYGLAILFFFSLGSPAWAKSYYFPRVSVLATISPDGSMSIVEDRTFSFEEDFTFAFVDLPKGNWDYGDFSISDNTGVYRTATPADLEPVKTPGTFFIQDRGDVIRVTWYFRASDESRTFRIQYRVLRAVTAYDDFAELYWKFLGDGWEVRTSDFRFRVVLPSPGAVYPAVRIWQHGPLNGEIRAVSPTEIVGTTSGVPPNTFIEGRILFPPSLVPLAAKGNGDRLTQVMDEEQRLAAAANRERLNARISIVLAVLLTLASGTVFVYLFRKYGNEYEPEVGEYYRELPGDYAPAVMGYIYRFGRSSLDDLNATILDLARRKHLSITQETRDGFLRDKKSFVFEKKLGADDNKLNRFERKLLTWAFEKVGDGSKVTDDEMVKYAKDASNNFEIWYDDWKESVAREAEKIGWLDKTSSFKVWVNVVTAIAAIGGGFLITAAMKSPAGVVPIVTGAVQIALSGTIRRRTLRGATDYAKWKAFRRFLTDFSELHRMPPAALGIWEQYLVYAVPLGVADEVIRSMERLSPAYKESAGYMLSPSFVSTSDGMSSLPDLSSLSSSLSSFAHAASSSMSSGGGGSGGSSGGGGGGGGGSGGGAG